MSKSFSFSFFIVIAAISLVLAHFAPLIYDEAYYWVFAKNLSLSYYDHPPMVAYLIHLTTLFTNSVSAIRLPAFFCFLITTTTMCALAKRMFSTQVASVVLVLTGCCWMLFLNSFITTPDNPLFMFWSITLYFFYIGVFEDRLGFLYLAGIACGFALMSKYTAVLLLLNLFVFLLCSNSYRRVLLRKDIYLSLAAALIVFSPVIYWNYHHNWVSFLFQFSHGIEVNQTYKLLNLVTYFLNNMGVMNPILFILLIYYAIRYWRDIYSDEKLLFLLINWLGVFVVFAYVSLTKQAEANWTAPMLISAIIFIAYFVNRYKINKIINIAVILSLLLYLAFSIMLIFMPKQLSTILPIFKSLNNNDKSFKQLKPYLDKYPVILACDYANASYIKYYLDIPVYVPKFLKFSHNYEYWQNKVNPDHALYVCNYPDNNLDLEAMKQHYGKINLIKQLQLAEDKSKILYLYEVTRWRKDSER